MIKFVFAYFEMPVDRDDLNKFLLSQVPNTKPNGFTILPGEFKVVHIALLDDNREKRIYCKSLQQPEWTIYYLEESRYFRKYRDI